MRRHARPAALALIATSALAAVGCAGSQAPDPPTPGPASSSTAELEAASEAGDPTTSSEPPVSMEAQAEEAFLAALRTYHDLVQAPDPDDPRLAQTFAGPSLLRVREILTVMAGAGQRSDGTGGAEITVVDSRRIPAEERDAGADVVEVTGCLVDDAVIVDRTGAVVDDDASSRLLVGRLRREADGWRLVEERTEQAWPDPEGCER